MALKTNLEMAELCQTAIIKILGSAQSYSIGEGPESKTYTMADMNALQAQFKYWKRLADSESAGSSIGISYPVF
jgi:hypothetical protein